MDLLIDSRGQIRCVYGERIDLASLGRLEIRRASHVEPDEHGHWWADMAPTGGPKLGPFALRSLAVEAETQWLARSFLDRKPPRTGAFP